MTRVLTALGANKVREVDIPTTNAGRAVVDFGTGRSLVSVTVAAPSIQAASVVTAQIAAIATADHTADEALVEEVDVRAGPPVADVGFTIYARTRNVKLSGKYLVSWGWV